ncbi:MAG TPA: DUF1700 domain-containing protein [Ruminiclostridium sp.]
MNKIEFISKLDYSLKGISYEDKKEIIYDYEEHFTVGIEQGKMEEDIAEALGDPKMIAKQFKNDYFIQRAENNKSAGNLASAVFASVGLGFLYLFMFPFLIAAASIVFSMLIAAGSVIISLVIALGSVLISFYAAALGLTLGGIGIILALFAEPYFPEFISIDINIGSAVFLSIGVFCLGILSIIGSIELSKISYRWSKVCLAASYNAAKKCVIGFYMWILKFLKMNVDIITRKKENDDAK